VSEYELLALINSLIENNPELLLRSCSKLYDCGNEPISILEGLLNITRDLLIKTNNSEYSELFYTSKDFHHELERISKLISKSKVIIWHNNLKNIEYQIKTSNQPRLWLEINLTSLLDVTHIIDVRNENDIELNLNSPKTLNNTLAQNYSQEKEKQHLNHNNDESTPKNNKNQIEKNNIENVKEKNLKEFKNSDTDTNTRSQYDESINLKEKWSLILSKLELPSTRMLLSQQAELLNIGKNSIEIGLSPNWENMIKSRKLIIENTVKKIFGEHMKINFTTKQNITSNTQKSYPTIKSNLKKDIKQDDDLKKKTTSQDQNINKNSKNLADFFNGEIIDIND